MLLSLILGFLLPHFFLLSNVSRLCLRERFINEIHRKQKKEKCVWFCDKIKRKLPNKHVKRWSYKRVCVRFWLNWGTRMPQISQKYQNFQMIWIKIQLDCQNNSTLSYIHRNDNWTMFVRVFKRNCVNAPITHKIMFAGNFPFRRFASMKICVDACMCRQAPLRLIRQSNILQYTPQLHSTLFMYVWNRFQCVK